MDTEQAISEVKKNDKKTFGLIEMWCFPQWGKLLATQEELYYYTDLNALLNGILHKKDSVCLWASRWSHLNDPEEMLLGLNNINLIVGKSWSNDNLLKLLKFNHYVSFSFYRDNLPMWKMYGDGGNGVMLVLDAKKLAMSFGSFFQPCIYKGTDEYKKAENAISNLKSFQVFKTLTAVQQQFVLLRMVQIFVSITKSDDYLYEKEARLIGLGNPHMLGECEQKYRLSGDKIIPYVEAFLPKESLKGVCLGPKVNSNLNKEILEEFLASKGYENKDVTTSKISYR